MCRLLGYATHSPVTLTELLGEEELREFTELSCKHADGWGFGWADADGITVQKAPDSARSSSAFAQAAASHPSDLALVHLRLATLGLGIGQENTHPFTHGQVAFAHNGSVAQPAALDALLPDDLAPALRGTTDSERYFLATLGAARDRAGDLAGGLADTVARIVDSLEFGGLNAMLVTPEQLIAVCRYDPAAQEREAEPDYYHLRYRITPQSVVISSSGWGAGWTTLRNGEMIVVQRSTLALSVHSISENRAA